MSDNGKTFKAAAKAIDTIMRDKDTQQYLSGVKVEWLFNLERAPWWGGVFERIVRMTKRCLKKMIGRAKLTYEELSTVVIEVEAVINSRPLSYVTADDMEQPLTPAHLLTGRRLLNLSDPICYQDTDDDFEVTSDHLIRRLTYLNRILNNFWKRWRNEYMSELRDPTAMEASHLMPLWWTWVTLSWCMMTASHEGLARIEELIVGRDGRTRGAVLRVASTSGRATVLQHPLQRLYPLEISKSTPDKDKETDNPDETEGDNGVAEEESTTQQCQAEVPVRPRRAAATQARNWYIALATCELEDDSDWSTWGRIETSDRHTYMHFYLT